MNLSKTGEVTANSLLMLSHEQKGFCFLSQKTIKENQQLYGVKVVFLNMLYLINLA